MALVGLTEKGCPKSNPYRGFGLFGLGLQSDSSEKDTFGLFGHPVSAPELDASIDDGPTGIENNSHLCMIEACLLIRSPSCSPPPAAGSPAPNAPPGQSARSSAVVPPRCAVGPYAGRMADYQQAPRQRKAEPGLLRPRQYTGARRAAPDASARTTCWSCRSWRPWGERLG